MSDLGRLRTAFVTRAAQVLPGPPVGNAAITNHIGSISPSSDRYGRLVLRQNGICTRHHAMLLTERDFWRTVNSPQLVGRSGFLSRITGKEKHLAMINKRHSLVSFSTLRAGFRLVLHGLSTKVLHGVLRELKAKAEAGAPAAVAPVHEQADRA